MDSCDRSAPDGEQINREQASDALVRKHLRVLIGGSALVALGNGVQKVLTFAVGVFLARGLGKGPFGVFSLAQSITRVGYFALEGGRLAAVKFVAHFHAKNDWGRVRAVLLGTDVMLGGAALLFALVVVVIAPYLAQRTYDKPDLTAALQIMSAEVPITALRLGYTAFQQAVHDLVPLVGVKCFGVPGLQLLGVILAWRARLSLPWFAAVFPMSAIGGLIAIQILHQRRFVHARQHARGPIPWGELLGCAAPLSLLGVLALDRPSVDLLVLGHGLTPEDLGVYAVASNASTLVTFPSVAIATVFMPSISFFHSRRDPDGLQRTLLNASALTTYTAMVAAGLLICLRVPAMHIFGKEFTTGGSILTAMVVARLFNSVSRIFMSVLSMADAPWAAVVDNAICVAVMCLGLFLAAPTLGLAGAGAVMIATMVLLGLLRSLRLWRARGLRAYDKHTAQSWAYFVVAMASAFALERMATGWTGTFLSLLGFSIPMAALGWQLAPDLLSALRGRPRTGQEELFQNGTEA